MVVGHDRRWSAAPKLQRHARQGCGQATRTRRATDTTRRFASTV